MAEEASEIDFGSIAAAAKSAKAARSEDPKVLPGVPGPMTLGSTAAARGPTGFSEIAAAARRRKDILSPGEIVTGMEKINSSEEAASAGEFATELAFLMVAGGGPEAVMARITKAGLSSKKGKAAFDAAMKIVKRKKLAARTAGTSAGMVAIGEYKAPDDEENPGRRRAFDAMVGGVTEFGGAKLIEGAGAIARTSPMQKLGKQLREAPVIRKILGPYRNKINPDMEDVLKMLDDDNPMAPKPSVGQVIEAGFPDAIETMGAGSLLGSGTVNTRRKNFANRATDMLQNLAESLSGRTIRGGLEIEEGSQKLAGRLVQMAFEDTKAFKGAITSQAYRGLDDTAQTFLELQREQVRASLPKPDVTDFPGLNDSRRAALAAVDQMEAVPTKEFKKRMAEEFTDSAGLPGDAELILKKVSGAQQLPERISFERMKNIRSRFLEMGRVDGKIMIKDDERAGRLMAGIADDIMEQTAKDLDPSGGMHSQWRDANALSRLSHEQYDGPFIRPLLKRGETSAEKVWRSALSNANSTELELASEIIKPNLSVQKLALPRGTEGRYAAVELSRAGGEKTTQTTLKRFDTPEAAKEFIRKSDEHGAETWNKIQGEFILDKMSKAKATDGSGISGNQFMASLKSFSNDSLNVLFPPGSGVTRAKLRIFGRALQSAEARAIESGATSASTPSVWLALQQPSAAAAVVSIPLYAAGVIPGEVPVGTAAFAGLILFGPAMAVKMMQKPAMFKWLTTGITSVPGSKQAVRASARLLALMEHHGIEYEIELFPTEEELKEKQEQDAIDDFGFDSSQMGSLGEE